VAKFDLEEEGMRWVKVTFKDEAVRAAKGALSHMGGDIVMDSPMPGFHDLLVSALSDESPWRTRYQGTGELFLESTLGGYHSMELDGSERWVFNTSTYWASDGDVKVTIHREGPLKSFWAGEGFFWYQTTASGKGTVVLKTDGPVEERTLPDERVVVTESCVIGRTEGIKFTIRRAAKSLIAHGLSGEKAARVYEGTGRVLLCSTPYRKLAVKSKAQATRRSSSKSAVRRRATRGAASGGVP
jgi:uncharacterized protein (AIM24 family)